MYRFPIFKTLNYHDILLAYGIKLADLKDDLLYLNYAIRDTNRLFILIRGRDTLHIVNQEGKFIGVKQFKLPSGRYFFALDIHTAEANQRGLKDFTVITGTYPKDRLHLSSVIFAKEVVSVSELKEEQNYFIRKDLAILPYPFEELNRNEPIYIYFEVYDLRQDEAGKTHFSVEYQIKEKRRRSFFARLNPFRGKRKAVTVVEERTGSEKNEPIYLQLNFGQLKEGAYELQVKVKDEIAGTSVEEKLEFVLQK